MACHFLLQGIFPTQGLNPDLLHCRQTLSHLSHQEVKYKVVCFVTLARRVKVCVYFPLREEGTSLVAQTLKRLSTMWETQIRSLSWEDPLEKEMASHSSILA